MVKNILPGTGNTGNLMSPLIPFNIIIDTDVGLLSLIYKSYMDPRIFNKDFFFGMTLQGLIYKLYTRFKENPLYLCINPEYEDSCDNLYNQFMTEKYNEILDLSVITEFYRLVRSFQNESEIKLTIVCERKEEVNLLKEQENTKECDIILANSLTPEKIKQFNQFYFKSIFDAIPYVKHIRDKTIYFANYGFNKDENGDISKNPLVPLLMENNVLNLIDVFRMDILLEEGEETDGEE